MTQGKIERYHRSLKNVVKLEHYYTPREVERAVGGFAEGFVNLPDAGRVAGQDPNLGGCSRSTRHHVPFGERFLQPRLAWREYACLRSSG